jgi:hypothetical protein
MPEVDKLLIFNGFHILLVLMISNIISTNSWEYIIDTIHYIFSFDRPGFWFLLLHIIVAYVMLTCLKIELGFHASIKFVNL